MNDSKTTRLVQIQHHTTTFQDAALDWAVACFGHDVAMDRPTRNFRFIEEAIELVQACGCSKEDVLKLVDYVYGRPAGEPVQEVGGVMVTLASLCNAQGIHMMKAGIDENARCWTIIDKIRAKQATKPHGSPLPGVVS